MESEKALYGRRSIRDFTDKQVDRAMVTRLLQAAVQAPSAINLQPWVFVVIQDKNLLKRYSDRAKLLAMKVVDTASMPAEFQNMLSDPTFNVFYNAGTLILICAKPVGQHPDWDCCLAGQNLMLAAHDQGLGTCPIGFAWPLFEQADVKQELNIPADYTPVLPIIVGFPSSPAPPVARKSPEILSWK
jgi:nitroreductase